jgi:phage terminase large subunit
MSTGNVYREFLERYYDDPNGFVINVLKVTPQPWQSQLLDQFARGTRRCSCAAGHGVGKSAVTSWAMLWFLLTRYPIKLVATSPTQSQLFDVLAAEVKRWITELPEALRELLVVKSERIELAASPTEAFLSFKVSRKDQPDAMQGIHSATTFLCVDEAAGVDEAVYEAAYGSMTSANAYICLIGNPTRSTGYFFDTHHVNKGTWYTMNVSCLDSPMVSPDFITEMRDKYGKESNQWRTRVLGLWPTVDDDTVIPRGLVEDAVSRRVKVPHDYPTIWGLDVARMGADKSVLVERQGRKVTKIQSWEKLDLMTLADRVDHLYQDAEQQPIEICCDNIGLGAGVVDRLRQLGVPAIGINVSETPSKADTYANKRAELWFTCREWLGGEVELPDHQQLVEDLVAPRFEYKPNGTLGLERKEVTAKRLRKSPDFADALCLTFASPMLDSSGYIRNKRKPERRNAGVVA